MAAVALSFAASVVATAHSQIAAQSWPSRFITVVVSFPAGGRPTCSRARLPRACRQLGQQVVVENRSGAGGNVGAAYVAKAAADGHTLLFATTSVVNNRFMYRNVPFDADRDFVPILLISKTPIVLVASPASGLKSLDTLIAAPKAKSRQDQSRLARHAPLPTSLPIAAEVRRLQADPCALSRLGADDRRSARQPDRCRHRPASHQIPLLRPTNMPASP